MSALDKIIEGILTQAQAEADGILAEAGRAAAGIQAKGLAKREDLQRQLEEASALECLEITKRAESANRQARRLALLAVRNQVIDEVMAEAKARLAEQADPERFQTVWQGDILLNNSIDAIFEAEGQALRDKAYKILMGGEAA